MPIFHVPEMNCGHCKAAIEKALRDADKDAVIDVDLGSRSVRVTSIRDASDLQAAMRTVGYESRLSG